MGTQDIDPDVVRWGLHLLDICTLTNDTSHSSVTQYQYDPNFNHVEYVREGYCEPCNVENDAAIASAFQEELSKVDSIEASGLSNAREEQLQASVLSQDWLGPSTGHSGYGHGIDPQAAGDFSPKCEDSDDPSGRLSNDTDEMGISYSYSNMEENSLPGEAFEYSLPITDESTLDGEVGKRLNQMVPVPHVPKTNEKMPSADEEISDHERLVERLQLYELVERKVEGDGNCQFRALSDQLYRSPEYHDFVREQIVQQLKYYREKYEGYVPMVYDDYLKKMSKKGEWGDHVTLQAAADWFGVKIFMITSFKDTCYIEILPHTEKSKRVLRQSYDKRYTVLFA